jgi:hypothetical protein
MATVKDVLRQGLEMSRWMIGAYVGDLNDADLVVRSVPGSNHIAWQMGHMIASSRAMLQDLGYEAPALPPGFEAAHSKETSTVDDPKKCASKEESLRLAEAMFSATSAAFDKTPDSAMDQPSPEKMREYAPTVCAVLGILGTHWIMHAGQFVPIRRKLGKPPLF